MKLNLILTILLLFIAIVGDYAVFKSKYSNSQLYRGFADSLVHASIGCVSAITFFSCSIKIRFSTCVYNVIICTIMSSFIDFDHFLEARSFNFKDFVLKRGIFHCTSFWILITIILHFLYNYTRNLDLLLLNFMLVIAYTSHHIRDSCRRGMWFYPYGHTRPLNYYLYVTLICVLPHIYAYLYGQLKMYERNYQNTFVV